MSIYHNWGKPANSSRGSPNQPLEKPFEPANQRTREQSIKSAITRTDSNSFLFDGKLTIQKNQRVEKVSWKLHCPRHIRSRLLFGFLLIFQSETTLSYSYRFTSTDNKRRIPPWRRLHHDEVFDSTRFLPYRDCCCWRIHFSQHQKGIDGGQGPPPHPKWSTSS